MYSFKVEENEKRKEFYEKFLPRVNSNLTAEDILNDNNDGVLNGNLLEFKNSIKNLNEHCFQCIKYLSDRRIKGKPVPANFIIFAFDTQVAYVYKSESYLTYIEQPYIGAASKNNETFVANEPELKLDLNDGALATENFISILKSNNFTKINIDENCIVGWANEYYRIRPTARKEDFIGDNTGLHKKLGEIRNPYVFKDYINPYSAKDSNIKFNYLMDRLNDKLSKKNLGAYYTHKLYAEKAAELVKQAVDRVPPNNKYVIIDRCAGTGNLEEALKNIYDKNGESLISHCIVSTIEYYEYKVLLELIGNEVKAIIPPIEAGDTFDAGMVRGSDALTQEYINHPKIMEFVNDPTYTIILYENPPFGEAHGSEKSMTGPWKQSFVHNTMKKSTNKNAADEIGNNFIWSAFEYYLRQPTDSYIVFSPVKYWKTQNLVNKRLIEAYAFNRRHFHLDIDACIMCALWANENDYQTECFAMDAYDIKNSSLLYCGKLDVKKIHHSYSSKFYDKRKFENDETGIACYSDGNEEKIGRKLELKPIYNSNIVGYMSIKGYGFDKPDLNCTLTTAGFYNAHGFYMRKDTYLEKLPMFAAARYITYNKTWTERTRIMKSADGWEKYLNDVQNHKLDNFLLKCLLFTCLETQNHMKTFKGSDNNFYINQLCLDNTNLETLASQELKRLKLNVTEKKLLELWKLILKYAKETEKYEPELTYGIYHISDELNTFSKDEYGDKHPDYKELDSNLTTLRQLLKQYYLNEIVPTLFEYEFLK